MEGTVSVISSDPPYKDVKVIFTQYHLKVCLIKYELDIKGFFYLNWLISIAVSLLEVTFAERMEKFTKFNTILIIILFQRFPSKSGIAIFALRVTRNYAYRPL